MQPPSRARLDPTWVNQYLNRGTTAPRTIPTASAVGPISFTYARPYHTRVLASYRYGYARDTYRPSGPIVIYPVPLTRTRMRDRGDICSIHRRVCLVVPDPAREGPRVTVTENLPFEVFAPALCHPREGDSLAIGITFRVLPIDDGLQHRILV